MSGAKDWWQGQRPFTWPLRGVALLAPLAVGYAVAVVAARLLHFTPVIGPLDSRHDRAVVAADEHGTVSPTSPAAVSTTSASPSVVIAANTPVASTTTDAGRPSSTASNPTASVSTVPSGAPTSTTGGPVSTTIPSGEPTSTTGGPTSTTVPATANHPPVVLFDEATARQGTTIHIDVLANDFDIDGDLDLLSVSVIDGPIGPAADPGSLSVKTRNGRDEIDYRAPLVTGVFIFTYQACDAAGACRSANVLVAVTV